MLGKRQRNYFWSPFQTQGQASAHELTPAWSL